VFLICQHILLIVEKNMLSRFREDNLSYLYYDYNTSLRKSQG
jgi:hypothetical protein